MDKKDAIVRLMIGALKKLPEGTETTVSDILNQVLTPDDTDLTMDDFFEINEDFRRKALQEGFILDSMKHNFNPGLVIDRSFVIRKINL